MLFSTAVLDLTYLTGMLDLTQRYCNVSLHINLQKCTPCSGF